MRKNVLYTAVAGVALAMGGLFAPSAANANQITVYVGTNPTSLAAINTSSTGFLGGTASGTNITVAYTATGTPILSQPTFDTTAIQVNTTGNASSPFYLAIVETGLTSPLGINNFLSSFSNTSFTGGVTSVTLTTEISPTNAAYGGTVLATTTYTSSNAAVNTVAATPNLTGPFSETALYEVQWNNIGVADDGISISSVPEPASLALMGTALLGLGAFVRRRRSL